MIRFSLALSVLFLTCACVEAQALIKPNLANGTLVNIQAPGSRAILALRRLEQNVISYRSLGELEESGKLAHVSLANFQKDFEMAAAEVNVLLAQIPPGRLRTEIVNALDSYRDGLFWWQQIDQPRVVHVSALSLETNRSRADTTYLSTIPYTIAIHWRQAQKYLNQAEKTLGR
jgi:hypothetical protein